MTKAEGHRWKIKWVIMSMWRHLCFLQIIVHISNFLLNLLVSACTALYPSSAPQHVRFFGKCQMCSAATLLCDHLRDITAPYSSISMTRQSPFDSGFSVSDFRQHVFFLICFYHKTQIIILPFLCIWSRSDSTKFTNYFKLFFFFTLFSWDYDSGHFRQSRAWLDFSAPGLAFVLPTLNASPRKC